MLFARRKRDVLATHTAAPTKVIPQRALDGRRKVIYMRNLLGVTVEHSKDPMAKLTKLGNGVFALRIKLHCGVKGCDRWCFAKVTDGPSPGQWAIVRQLREGRSAFRPKLIDRSYRCPDHRA